MEKLKRAVIKEEYIAITGDYEKAIILNQFIYWSERVKDFDMFIKQENERAISNGYTEIDFLNGWIYKTAEELSQETMLNLSVATIRTHIKALIQKGFLDERNNSKYKWDRTKQYRVNLVAIAQALYEKDYPFEDYKFENAILKIKNGSLEIKNGNDENSRAIPKITSKTTSQTTFIESYNTEFENLWKMYPNKKGKPKALKAYQKARKNGVTFEEVKQGIENYCKQIKAKQTKMEYIKHGSTWFNSEGWTDEYDFTPKGERATGGNDNGEDNQDLINRISSKFTV